MRRSNFNNEDDLDRDNGGRGNEGGAVAAVMRPRQPMNTKDLDSDESSDEGSPPPPSFPSRVSASRGVVRKQLDDSDDDDDEGCPPPLPPAPINPSLNPKAAPNNRKDYDSDDEDVGLPPAEPTPVLPPVQPKKAMVQVDSSSDEDVGPPPQPQPPAQGKNQATKPKKEEDEDEDEGKPPELSEVQRLRQQLAAAQKQLDAMQDKAQEEDAGSHAPAAAPAPAPALAPSEVFGEVKGSHVAFIIDCSGSMALDFRSGYPNRFKTVVRELNYVLQTQLAPNTNFHIYAFKEAYKRWRDVWSPVNPENVRAAMQFVASLAPGGGGSGLVKSTEDALTQRGIDGIYLLTDGCPSGWGDLSRFARGVPITCITMGSDPATLRIMDTVAQISGGSVRHL